MNLLWNLHGKCAAYEMLTFHMQAHQNFYIKLALKLNIFHGQKTRGVKFPMQKLYENFLYENFVR